MVFFSFSRAKYQPNDKIKRRGRNTGIEKNRLAFERQALIMVTAGRVQLKSIFTNILLTNSDNQIIMVLLVHKYRQ